jgi:hypothetical protein
MKNGCKIIEKHTVASTANNQGLYSLAVLLYCINQDYSKVISIIREQLKNCIGLYVKGLENAILFCNGTENVLDFLEALFSWEGCDHDSLCDIGIEILSLLRVHFPRDRILKIFQKQNDPVLEFEYLSSCIGQLDSKTFESLLEIAGSLGNKDILFENVVADITTIQEQGILKHFVDLSLFLQRTRPLTSFCNLHPNPCPDYTLHALTEYCKQFPKDSNAIQALRFLCLRYSYDSQYIDLLLFYRKFEPIQSYLTEQKLLKSPDRVTNLLENLIHLGYDTITLRKIASFLPPLYILPSEVILLINHTIPSYNEDEHYIHAQVKEEDFSKLASFLIKQNRLSLWICTLKLLGNVKGCLFSAMRKLEDFFEEPYQLNILFEALLLSGYLEDFYNLFSNAWKANCHLLHSR